MSFADYNLILGFRLYLPVSLWLRWCDILFLFTCYNVEKITGNPEKHLKYRLKNSSHSPIHTPQRSLQELSQLSPEKTQKLNPSVGWLKN